jgi:hypothetical protein
VDNVLELAAIRPDPINTAAAEAHVQEDWRECKQLKEYD